MKRPWMFAMLLLGLAACGTVAPQGQENEPSLPASKPAEKRAVLPDPSTGSGHSLGLAPELTNDIWINVEAPLRLADLRGKVVALEMWTFG